MPYTISHPAVVLPFSRRLARHGLLSATVIGSMVPDFGLFFPWRPDRVETHSASALLTFSLPLGLFVYWLFQRLVKTPVLEVLPDGAYARSRPYAQPARFDDIKGWLRAACGVLLGAMTHLIWDGFTHEGARGVRMFPILDYPVLEYGRHHIDAVRLMQDLGSLVGLAVVLALLAYALRPGRDAPIPNRPLSPAQRRGWVLAYLATALCISAAFFLRSRWADPQAHSVIARAFALAIAGVRGPAIALLLVSLALNLTLRSRR